MVQKSAARFVKTQYDRQESVSQLLNQLQWPILQGRRTQMKLIMIHKIINNRVSTPAHKLILIAWMRGYMVIHVQDVQGRSRYSGSPRFIYIISIYFKRIQPLYIDIQDVQHVKFSKWISAWHHSPAYRYIRSPFSDTFRLWKALPEPIASCIDSEITTKQLQFITPRLIFTVFSQDSYKIHHHLL